MQYKIFNKFFCKQLEINGKNKIDKLNVLGEEKLVSKLYNQLISYIENDVIRVLYQEYRLYQDKYLLDKDQKEKLQGFLKLINTEEYQKYFNGKYPLIRKNLSKKIDDYISFILEIYKNFQNDKLEIESNIGKKCGQILDIIIMQGDNHNGKSASKIITENGNLYYKPINSMNMDLFYEILDLITNNNNDINVEKIRYYSNDSHIWMEEIKYESCTDIEEVKNYYLISGIYLMIFYIFSSYDMHHENIISKGKTPIIVDFETITHASISKSNEETNLKDIVNSVINSAFIPYINDDGAFDINLSGILSETDISENNEQYVYNIDDNNGFEVKKYKSCFYVKNQVSLNNEEVIGKYISLEEVRQLIRKGFEFAGDIICSNKKKVESIIIKYMKNEKLELRQLLRPTQVYHQFIESCKHPNILVSEKKQEEILMILENNFNPSSYGYLRVEEEIFQLKNGYIPKFYTIGYSKDLYSNGNIICENYFVETAMDLTLRKIQKLDKYQMNYQMKLIDYSILTLTTSESFGETKIIQEIEVNEVIDEIYVKNVVSKLIDEIENSTITYNKDIKSIFSPHLSEKRKMWRLRDFGLDLYEDGGVIMLLATYGYIYKDKKSTKTATQLLNYLNMFKNDKKITNQSIFTGKGCLLYLNYNLYKILEKSEENKLKANEYRQIYYSMANNTLDNILEMEFVGGNFDFMGGIISSLYFIANAYLDKPEYEENLKIKLQEITQNIIEYLDYDWFNEIGYAHGITGTVLCLSVLYKVTKDNKLLSIIKKLIIKENNLIANNGTINLSYTWCKGLTGILLGRQLCCDNIKILSNIEENEVEKVALKFSKELKNKDNKDNIFSNKNLSLCHGLYGNIEIIHRLGMDNNFKKDIYIKHFDSFEDLNWVDSLNVPINTFMLGNTGIAYVLLELFNDNIPSILSLEIFK